MDPEIEKPHKEKKPLTLKAKMLKRIKEYEKEHVRVPGFVEGGFMGYDEPSNENFIDSSGKNEIDNYTMDDETEALNFFEDEFLKMLEKETKNFEKNKNF